MSSVLSDRLQRLAIQRKADTLKAGLTKVPVWAFCTTVGTPFSAPNVRHAMSRVLKKAELPGHFTPHCLRHTYASLLLQQGESIVYVQRQLGHSSIQLTVDTYGKWLPMGPTIGLGNAVSLHGVAIKPARNGRDGDTFGYTFLGVRSNVDRNEKEPTQQSRLSRSTGDAGARGGASHPRTGAARAATPKLDRRTFLGDHTWPHITLPPAGNVWSVTIHDFGKQWVEMSWGKVDPIQGKRGEKGASRNRKMNETRARSRAKGTIRKKCLTIGADHLVTLTYRANVDNRSECYTIWNGYGAHSHGQAVRCPMWRFLSDNNAGRCIHTSQ